MTVFLWKHQTTYISVLKIACTSVKSMLFQVENGRPFEPFVANGRSFHIHRLYPSVKFKHLPHDRIADHARFALVRDPIRRFLSAFSNCVLHHRELSAEKAGAELTARGLKPDPELAEFIDHLSDYAAAVPSIDHHCAPMVRFLGMDAGYYAHVFPIEKIAEFQAELSRRVGQDLVAPRLQTGGPKLDPDMLAPRHVRKLRKLYERDYEIFGAWF